MKRHLTLALATGAALVLASGVAGCKDKKEPTPATTKPADNTNAAANVDAATKKKIEEAKKAAAAAAATATKATEDAKKAAAKAMADAKAKAAAAAKAAKATASAAKIGADHIKFTIDHTDSKKGLVHGSFKSFSVVSANTDLANPANAKAVVSIDVGSISTGNGQRDGHLKTPDFFDVAKFGKATLTVDGVTKGATPNAFNAKATLDLHGVKKSFPVTFDLLKKNEDGSIVVKGGLKGAKRADWNVGGAPEKSGAAATFDASLQLTLKNK